MRLLFVGLDLVTALFVFHYHLVDERWLHQRLVSMLKPGCAILLLMCLALAGSVYGNVAWC